MQHVALKSVPWSVQRIHTSKNYCGSCELTIDLCVPHVAVQNDCQHGCGYWSASLVSGLYYCSQVSYALALCVLLNLLHGTA